LDLSTNVERASKLKGEQELMGELAPQEEASEQARLSSRVHGWAEWRNDERT
jgi:hypothetical protein